MATGQGSMMPKPILPVDASDTPVTPTKPLGVGKGSNILAGTTRDEIWATAKRIWGNDIPSKTAWAIWGAAVVDARRVEECPECGWAGDVFMLCPYHQDRECPDCHGIAGTVFSCRCE